MTISRNSVSSARTLLFVCTVLLLPLGVVYSGDTLEVSEDTTAQKLHALIEAGELSVDEARAIFNEMPPVDWVQARYAKGANGIDAKVFLGELTVEEATGQKAEMIAVMQSMAFYMEVFGLDPRAAGGKVRAEMAGKSKVTETAGKSKITETAGRSGDFEWMYGHLADAGVPREQIGDVMAGIKKIMAMMRASGREAFELDPKLREYFASIGLSEAQIELTVGLAARGWEMTVRTAKAPTEAAPTESFEWMYPHLMDSGISRVQLRDVMGGVAKVVGAMKKQGDAFELDPKLREYFVSQGLTDAQIKVVLGVSSRQIVGGFEARLKKSGGR